MSFPGHVSRAPDANAVWRLAGFGHVGVLVGVLTPLLFSCNGQTPASNAGDAKHSGHTSAAPSAEKGHAREAERNFAGGWNLVAAGWDQTCGLRNHTLHCWGGDDDLDPAEQTQRRRPVQIDEANDWSAVSLGAGHGCGIRGRHLYCWGTNRFGVLGLDRSEEDLRSSREPRQVGTAADWDVVATGYDHSAAVRAGQLFGWGRNGPHVLPMQATPIGLAPKPLSDSGDWQAVSFHKESGCGLRRGSLYCWGSNDDARLGQGVDSHTMAFSAKPLRVGQASDWSAVTVGDYFICGLRAGALYCWGANNSGQQGTGDDILHMTPVRVGMANDWTAIAAGEEHVCGLRGRNLYCWGRDYDGQLGIGKSDRDGCYGGKFHQCHDPLLVDPANEWDSVTVGGFHTCGIRSGRLFCWGRNGKGQLGLGDTVARAEPREVR